MATSFRRMVPLYSIIIVCFSMSLAANSPRPCKHSIQSRYSSCPQKTSQPYSVKNWEINQIIHVNTDLDTGAGQIDVGSPLTLHPAVLRRPRVHYWRLAMGGTTFSLSYILVRPCTAAGNNLWLWPLCWETTKILKTNVNQIRKQNKRSKLWSQLPYHQWRARRAGFWLGSGTASWVEHKRQLYERVASITEWVPDTRLHSWELE